MALFLIGMANGILFDRTDIIYIYAVLGVLFLPFMYLSTELVLWSALALVGAPIVGQVALTRVLPDHLYRAVGAYASLVPDFIRTSAYPALALTRAHELVRELAHPQMYVDNLDSLAMFVLGLYAARRGVFRNLSTSLGGLARVMWGSLAVRLAASAWLFARHHPGFGWDGWVGRLFGHAALDGLVDAYSTQALAVFYVCFVVMILQDERWKRLSLPIARVGRFALSNYILHCFIGTTLFFGYGFGLYGRFGIGWGEGVALIACGFLVGVSSWWLRRFDFGPAEWLWRTLTYWRPQAFRRAVR